MTKKCYSYGKLFSENNFAVLIILISRWQFLSSRCQIRRGYVTAKDMVSQNTRKSCRLVKSMNIFEKNKLCPFSFVKAKTKERKKAFSCESAEDPTSSSKGFFLQPRRMATRNRRTWTQIRYEWKAVGWNEFTEAVLKFGWKKLKKHVCNVTGVRRRTVSCCSRSLSCLWHLYKPSYN